MLNRVEFFLDLDTHIPVVDWKYHKLKFTESALGLARQLSNTAGYRVPLLTILAIAGLMERVTTGVERAETVGGQPWKHSKCKAPHEDSVTSVPSQTWQKFKSLCVGDHLCVESGNICFLRLWDVPYWRAPSRCDLWSTPITQCL